MMLVDGLTPDDPAAWEANAAALQATIDGHRTVSVPDGTYHVGRVYLPDDRPTLLSGYGAAIRAADVAGNAPADVTAWLAQAPNPEKTCRHVVAGFELGGKGQVGAGIRPGGHWTLRDLDVSGFYANVQLTQDHCYFESVDLRKGVAGFLIGPTTAHAGGHTMIAGGIDDCGAAWLLDPSGRLEGWRCFGPHCSSLGYVVDRLPGTGQPAFMSTNEWIGVRAEWCELGTFRDPGPDKTSTIRGNTFLGGGPTMSPQGAPVPPPEVADWSDNEVIRSTWLDL